MGAEGTCKMTGKIKEGCRRTDITGRPRTVREKQTLETVSWHISERVYFSGRMGLNATESRLGVDKTGAIK